MSEVLTAVLIPTPVFSDMEVCKKGKAVPITGLDRPRGFLGS
jgi:hypothetical protein